MRAIIEPRRPGTVVTLDTEFAANGEPLLPGSAVLTFQGNGQQVTVSLMRHELAAMLRSLAHLLDGTT